MRSMLSKKYALKIAANSNFKVRDKLKFIKFLFLTHKVAIRSTSKKIKLIKKQNGATTLGHHDVKANSRSQTPYGNLSGTRRPPVMTDLSNCHNCKKAQDGHYNQSLGQ